MAKGGGERGGRGDERRGCQEILGFEFGSLVGFISKILQKQGRRIVIMNSNNLRMNVQSFHPVGPTLYTPYRPQQQQLPAGSGAQNYPAFHNIGRSDRPMYSSTIQPTVSQGSFHSDSHGLGALEKMGRFIKEQSEPKDQASRPMQVPVVEPAKPLTFRMDRNPRTKMASSSIFTSNNTQHSMILTGNENNVSLSKLTALMANKKIVEVREQEVGEVEEGQEERRKREILSFKSEGDILNKKIQNTFGVAKKDGENKLYFQLPTRKNQRSQAGQQITQAKEGSLNMAEPLKMTETSKMQIPAQLPPTPFAPINSNQQVLSIPSVATQGMFKKKNPYLSQEPSFSENRPLAKVIPMKSQKVIKKICKSDFIIGKKMGKGQFGEVMMVIHKETGFLCAMKVMSKKQIREEKYVNQVARELSIQFYLNHRYIAPLYGYFEDEENVYLLVEFCADGQLLQKMRKSHRLEDPETSPIIREVCEGLDYIHKEQILHRDIKPENILFQFGTVKISDFGWAVYSGNQMRRTVSGTPLYYCPQLVMETAYDEKIDIWSVGMMTYQCLIGKIPFKIYSQFDLNRIVTDEITFPEYVDVTDEAKDFILSSMRKKAEERMEIREMLRHPFITKYMKNRNVDEECLKEIRRVLGG